MDHDYIENATDLEEASGTDIDLDAAILLVIEEHANQLSKKIWRNMMSDTEYKMKKFEYHIESFEIGLGMDISPKLKNLGLDGWELISFTVTNTGNYYNAIFKRVLAQ